MRLKNPASCIYDYTGWLYKLAPALQCNEHVRFSAQLLEKRTKHWTKVLYVQVKSKAYLL